MNLSDMNTFVWAQADTDSTDAPSSVLEVYARAAYRDIIARVFPWPDNRKNFTFTATVNQPAYLFTSMSPADIEYAISVVGPTSVLNWISKEELLDMQAGSTSSGTPVYYAVDSTSLYLWPAPAEAEAYTVVGYRSFAAWPAGSAEPDLPRAFDEPICWYMLSKYYLAQEDLELSQMYQALFDAGVDQQIASALRSSSSSAGPRIFGGVKDGNWFSYESWMRRNTEG